MLEIERKVFEIVNKKIKLADIAKQAPYSIRRKHLNNDFYLEVWDILSLHIISN